MVAADEAAVNLFDNLLSEGFIEGNEALDEGTFVDNKEDLVGVAFLLMNWTHGEFGDSGIPKVTCEIVLANGERATMVDMSQGIRLQLEDVTRKLNGWEDKNKDIPTGTESVPPKPLYFPHGLRVSSYTFRDELAGTSTPASTFYLDSSK